MKHGKPDSGFLFKMKIKVNNNIKWSMSFAPVMACKTLKIEEKILLNSIMSMKYSFDEVYATRKEIQELTGLSDKQYDSALSGLAGKNLVVLEDGHWWIAPGVINQTLGVEVYDMNTFII